VSTNYFAAGDQIFSGGGLWAVLCAENEGNSDDVDVDLQGQPTRALPYVGHHPFTRNLLGSLINGR